MGFLFGSKQIPDVECGAASAPSLQPDQGFDAAKGFAFLTKLPGVVVYQRLVTPAGEIRYTYISEGAHDLFGVSPEEILSDPKALFSCHSADYSAMFRERLLAASKTLTVWDVEASIVTTEGRKKYTHAIALPERKPDGSVLWTGIILDETRTRTAVVEGLSQGFLLYDAEDRLILRNSHFLKLFPSLGDVAVPGVRYEDVLRATLTGNPAGPIQDPELLQQFREQMEDHREPTSMCERQLNDERWVLMNEQRTEEGTVVVYTDITELKRGERRIYHLAYHDSLTGLPNRTLYRQRVEEALTLTRARGTTGAVMCLDLDNFKNVNDTLGHPAGDELLKCVSERLRACLRDTDTIARLGGDEFGIVAPDLNQSDHVTALAWRLLDAVSQPMDIGGHQVIITVSIGIAAFAEEVTNSDELLKKADLALYRAKADGRATFRFFEVDMDAIAQERRLLEMDLRHAVTKGQLELHYQAQVDLFSNEILGFEALVRWHRPGRSLVPPADFIPLAEETGLIARLGEWVLRQACTDAVSWPESIRVAVNVSPAQFKNRDLPKIVAQVLKETGLPADRLEIEITESLLLRDVEANLKILEQLKDLGIRITMDDFGTGFSSLGNLRSFRFDKIKIDRSFVSDIEQCTDAAAIVRAVVSLGQSLGIATCAEGVETVEQLCYLRSEGCIEAQGFYYSKPKPLAEIGVMLQTTHCQPANLPPLEDADSSASRQKVAI